MAFGNSTAEFVELRYSLNGITESQIQGLFNQIEREQNQLVIKRLSDSKYALSADDIVLEGNLSPSLVEVLSRVYPPPLSCKIQTSERTTESLKQHAAFNWINKYVILSGVTILPIRETQRMIGFSNPTHFLNLITSTNAGSFLKPLLAVKPRGIISIDAGMVNIIFPAHRIDFILAWIREMSQDRISLDWLSGSTGELNEEMLASIGSFNPNQVGNLEEWLQKAKLVASSELNTMYRRALASLL